MLLSHYCRFLSSLLCLVPLTLLVSSASSSSPSVSSRPAPPRSALLIVDMQNCFSPTGPLAVPSFLSIIPTINRLHSLPLFSLVALSQDYHPPNHISFADTWPDNALPFTSRQLHYDAHGHLCHSHSLPPAHSHHLCPADLPLTTVNQTLWPTHCVADTPDSHFHPSLTHYPTDLVIRKGQSPHVDSYSAFSDSIDSHTTPLAATLHGRHIRRLYVVGVALEVCVYATVMDAVAEGLQVVVVEDGVGGIDGRVMAVRRAEMEAAGVRFVRSWQVEGGAEGGVEGVATVVERKVEVEVEVAAQ